MSKQRHLRVSLPPVSVLALVACALVAFALPFAGAQVSPTLPGGSSPSTPTTTNGLPTDGAGSGIGDLFGSFGFTGGLLAGIGVAVGVALAALAFMGGTKFVTSENVLENDARREIFEYLKANPGTHLRATAAALGLSTTNVLWHLRKLEAANLIASRKFEGYKLFYPVEGGQESRRNAIASSVLRNPHAVAILEAVLAEPAVQQREIARRLGVNHGTIRWHLRKLIESGLLLELKQQNETQHFVSTLGTDLLATRGRVAAGPGAAVTAGIATTLPPLARADGAHAVSPLANPLPPNPMPRSFEAEAAPTPGANIKSRRPALVADDER
ncbi:MAG: winged helix-turn-helix transcriptional regulator [Thermoplasmatota archaeon]